MIAPSRIKELLERKPFRPFELCLFKRACRAIATGRRIKVLFDDEIGVGQNGFQFGQNSLRPQLNELLSLPQPFHSVGPERLEPCKQRAV